ncbi:MAG: hypothetical protein ABJA80_04065 [bacterium]
MTTVLETRLADLLRMVDLAREVFAALPESRHTALPPDAQRALAEFYDLDDYRRKGGGIAPPDAPHLPLDGGVL